MDRWVVMLGGECPEVYGLFGTYESARRAAGRWNAEHRKDEYGASVMPLYSARDLAKTS